MSGEPEIVLGEIPVVSRLGMGSERLAIFPTNRRILVAHIGKRGAGRAAGSNILGRLSGAVEDLLKGGRESMAKRKLTSQTPGEILGSDRDNFVVEYREVVNMELQGTSFLTRITMLTGREKFEFSTGQSIDRIAALLAPHLGDRLTVKKVQ